MTSSIKQLNITLKKTEEVETDILHGKKRSQNQLARKFLQGGGFLPEDECYWICIFCKHSFIDEPVENLWPADRCPGSRGKNDILMDECHLPQ